MNTLVPDRGIFIISLDFELVWGLRDKRTIEKYEINLQGARNAIKEMLALFRDYDVHATWATTGFLFFENSEDLKKNIPSARPRYENDSLSPYRYIEESPSLEKRYHFAPDLIDLIRKHEGMEVGSHTFSHYYCLERGADVGTFRSDISAAINIADKRGLQIKSLVFPRNQLNAEFLPVLNEFNIQCFRGTEEGFMYKAGTWKDPKIRRALRLIDAYLNISGHHTYNVQDCMVDSMPFNIPSSRFLRPYSKNLSFLDGLRLGRIKRAMSFAASNREVFHLWWHPHNFGRNTEQNIAFLKRVLDHFSEMREQYGMISLNMGELADYLNAETGTLPYGPNFSKL